MTEPVVKAGSGVVVIKDDKYVLVGQRQGSHGDGLWSFPGGHIDPTDTSFRQQGSREVREETGIDCLVISPDGLRDDLFTTFDILSEDGTKRYVTVYLLARYLGGGEAVDGNPLRIKPLEDKCKEWHWKTLDELVAMIRDEKAKAWIPILQVNHYLRPLIG